MSQAWELIKSAFHSAISLPPEERAAYLDSAAGSDPEARAELEDLIRHYEQMGGFLDAAPAHHFENRVRPGDILAGRYTILEKLGEGGMGEVFKAEDHELHLQVALKTLPPEWLNDPAALARLRREVHLARLVSHPNVCRVYDLGFHEQPSGRLPFLTMELLDGETLAARIGRAGALTPQEALPLIRQICEGIDAAHRAGVLHRDLKAENIFLHESASGVRAVIADFGLARPFAGPAEGVAITEPGRVIGTPACMAPEQLRGAEANAAADIYALGVVLFRMVTGEYPFRGASDWDAALSRLTTPPIPPRQIRPELASCWDRAILQCLALEPDVRPATASEVVELLTQSNRPARRLAAIGLALTALSLAILWYWLRPAPLPADKRLAVLPFAIHGSDPAVQAMADGLAQSLTLEFARLRKPGSHLTVIPYADVRALPRAARARDALGANLAVQADLEMLPAGWRVNARLTDLQSGKILRSHSFTARKPKWELAATALDLIDLPSTAASYQPSDIAVPPPDAFAFFQQGQGYLVRRREQDVPQAIGFFKRAIQQDPKFAAAHAALARVYTREFLVTHDKSWLVLAAGSAAEALRLDPMLPSAHVALGMVAKSSANPIEAIAHYKRALEIDPNAEDALALLGNAYADIGEPLKAEAALQQATQLNPGYWSAYSDLARFYTRHGEFAKAEPLFKTAAELAPDNALAQSNVGGLYLALGRYREAQTVLEAAGRIDMTARIASNLGTAYFLEKRYAEAAGMYTRATALSPKDYKLWSNLGDSLAATAQVPRAREAWTHAAALIRDDLAVRHQDPELLAAAARMDAKLDHPAPALQSISAALRLSPSDASILLMAAQVYELTGRRDQALKTVASAIAHGAGRAEIEQTPDFDSLRQDPRYPGVAHF
jgi:tetratricopeptide (TPR) repeat protein